jgi:signal transduction histidine kinase
MSERARSELAVLANAMAHRLATPARIVSGNVRILSERLDSHDPEAGAALAAIDRGSGWIDAIVDGLTRYSRAADAPQERLLVDAAAEAQHAIDGLADEIAASGAVIAVADLPVVRAEPRALRTLFRCQFDNAIRAGGAHPPRIAVACFEEPSAWRMTVSDDGVGVAAADRERVFEPFVSIRHGQASGGAGLGLTLARDVVERHGGKIRLDGDPDGGAGTTVHVVLPRDDGRPL